ncbi:hypothetical protein CLV56_0123 [Mumia flava]|uniref:Subtilisin inhibitor-like n=1 Tax=Mumia flava TaxID=1348852 RepID=A0A2M9BD87_9ACTN|nr:DUF6636 domain-containing protein [Mumia flava]PJJ55920.1 hypothetical protein CLV56_0123 [Mumia flava]
MRVRELVIVVAGLVVLAGCGSATDLATADPGGSPSKEPTAVPTVPKPVDGSSTELPRIGKEMPAFSSPSGNIVCRLGTTGARCDIDEHSFKPPKRPAGCEGRWGRTVAVDARGAGFVCGTKAPSGDAPVLKYGRSTVIGDFGCTSARTGVTCVDTQSWRGFTVSRAVTGTF